MPPDHLAKEMGPWLTETKQGMWQRQIPLAETTICLGWLLFSAPEYNLRALRRKIRQVTGAEVGLRFRSIKNGIPQNTLNNMTRTKATHLEVDHIMPVYLRRHIANIYSDQAAKFPLGIAMCMVPELQLASMLEERINASKLQALQECFLVQTEPHKIYITPNSIHNLQQAYATFIGVAPYVTCVGHTYIEIFLHCMEVQLHENGIISYVKLICNLPF